MIKLKSLLIESEPSESPIQIEAGKLRNQLVEKYPELEDLYFNVFSYNQKVLHIAEIRIKKEFRGQGIGRKVIEEIKAFADKNDLIITLSPGPERGYKRKLDIFYKSLGFKNNSGRKRDYSLSSFSGRNMIRRPNRNESVEDSIEETKNTFKMYHGGSRWEYIPREIIPSSKGRYECGVGIYLTTSYNTARNYAKGNKVVQIVEIDKNYKDLKDINVNIDELIQFVNSVFKLKNKKNIIDALKDYVERTNKKDVPLFILNNLIVNFESGAGKVGLIVIKYFVEKGADALLERKGEEDWLVVFNPRIIKKVEVINSTKITSNFEFTFPKIIKESKEISKEINEKYPLAGNEVDGYEVGDRIDNTSSIAASFNKYKVLDGIREVPMSDFSVDPKTFFYAVNDNNRSLRLKREIEDSNRIDPLIVAIDKEGPYVLEGGHRLLALHYMNVKSFPALVVLDLD